MKNWPAAVVVVAVAIAVVISIWTFAGSRAPSGEHELRAMETSVDELRTEVRELRTAVRELREALAVEATREDVAPEDEAASVDSEAVGLDAGEVNVEPVNVVLEIGRHGACTLDGRAVAREQLQAELKKVLAANPAMTLSVLPDETVPTVEVNRVLDDARAVGIHRIEIATAPGGDSAGAE